MVNTNHPSTVPHYDGTKPVSTMSALHPAALGRSKAVGNRPTSPCITAPQSDDHITSDETYPITGEWGLDTVKVGFPVNPEQSSFSEDFWLDTNIRSERLTGVGGDRHIGYLPCENGKVRVTLYMQRGATCHLEFNPARLAHGKSPALFCPDELIDVVEGLLKQVQEHAWPAFAGYTADGAIVWDDNWADQVRVRRLDIARNFTVSEPALLMRVLPSTRGRNQKSQALYEGANEAWGVERRTKDSGKDLFYRKGSELAARGIDPGSTQNGDELFRFETQLKKERLTRYALTRLSDVNNESTQRALEGRWEASRWGSPLPGSSGFLDALDGLTPAVMDRLMGFMLLDAAGEAERRRTPAYVRKNRALARQHGLTPGLPVEFLGKSRMFLSLWTGALEEITPI